MEKKLENFFKYIKNNKNNYLYNDVHIETEEILKKTLNNETINNFRSNIISYLSGSLSFPDQNRGIWFDRGIIKNYLSNLKHLYLKKKMMISYLKSKNINFIDDVEDKIGGPIVYKFLNFNETGTNLTNNFYNSVFDEYFKKYKINKILEVGGGIRKVSF